MEINQKNQVDEDPGVIRSRINLIVISSLKNSTWLIKNPRDPSSTSLKMQTNSPSGMKKNGENEVPRREVWESCRNRRWCRKVHQWRWEWGKWSPSGRRSWEWIWAESLSAGRTWGSASPAANRPPTASENRGRYKRCPSCLTILLPWSSSFYQLQLEGVFVAETNDAYIVYKIMQSVPF